MCDVAKMRIHLRNCDDQKIAVYIMWKGEQIGLCLGCWNKIADKDISWGNGNGENKIEEEIEVPQDQNPLSYDEGEIEKVLKEEIPEKEKIETIDEEYMKVGSSAWARKDALHKKIDIKEMIEKGEQSLREEAKEAYRKRGRHKKRRKERKEDAWNQNPTEDY